MNAIERRIRELEHYQADRTARGDLGAFWDGILEAERRTPLQSSRDKAETPLTYMDAYKVVYEGDHGTPIHAWYALPRFRTDEPLPCVVSFHGYTGGKGYPEQYAEWLMMGVAVLAIDVRGQGGETGNDMPQPFGTAKGWVTQGILDKRQSYYKAMAVDALRAVRLAAEQPEIDASRIAVVGASQGGGLALLTAALSDIPALAVGNIPNLCHMDFGLFNSTGSLSEAADFLNRFPDRLEQVLETLSYFDIVNLADRIRVPVLLSAGLKDTVCMPETIYAAYNRIASDKAIYPYPFAGHWVTGEQHRRTLEFVGRLCVK